MLVICLLGIVELSVTYLLNNPNKIPKEYLGHFKEYYRNSDKNIIQFQADKAKYHDELFYTLKPGNFSFSNREFKTTYHINQLGLRDDEKSLVKPQIIVLGDSYAMGWGVEQDSTFSQILERQTGKRVLNAAISSYGTARELKLLEFLDLSELEFLIIQYCNNDFEENRQFALNSNKLVTSAKNIYQAISNDVEEVNDYYFMKHFSYLGNSIFFKEQKRAYKPVEEFILTQSSGKNIDHLTDTDILINVLSNSEELKKVPQIILFPLDDIPYHYFMEELRVALSDTTDKEASMLASKITLLDNSEILNAEDYYILDQHLKNSGHSKVANSLKNIIASKINSPKETHFNQELSFNTDSTKNSFRMDSTIEWGPSIEINLSKEILQEGYTVIDIEYDIQSNDSILGTVVVSIDEDQNLFWEGKKTTESFRVKAKNNWNRVLLRVPLYNLEEKLSPEQEVKAKVFYWNNEKSNLSIDNFNVSLRKEQAVVYQFTK